MEIGTKKYIIKNGNLTEFGEKGECFTGPKNPLFWPNKTLYESKKAERW